MIRDEYVETILDFLENHYQEAETDDEKKMMCAVLSTVALSIGVPAECIEEILLRHEMR